ncbi:MAG: hypothetical protein K0R55_3202 [Sporomusa sp.]|jgi:hypothetical protein|nr:hypothetical protein [Sporomusa sp.]
MDGKGTISPDDLILILVATALGTLARYLTLKVDYRQYPTHPNGYLIHLVIAFIAAAIGAVAIPAIKSNNYTAVTFLAIAIQHFRDVRKTERESLKDLECTEFTPRGEAYIDGIAKTFESRNYFSLIVALSTAATIEITRYLGLIIFFQLAIGICIGYLVFIGLSRFSKGKLVGDIASVKLGVINVRDSELYVDGVFVSNTLGTANSQKMVQTEGLAVVIEPNEDYYRVTLDNFGQRKAMLFEATRSLGVKRYHYTRKDYESGKTIIVLVPLLRDAEKLINVVQHTPLLESVKKSHSVMQSDILGD